MKKNVFKILVAFVIGAVFFTACNNAEKDDPIVIPVDTTDTGSGNSVELADGYYVFSGDIADITAKGLLLPTINESGQVARESLMETFQVIDPATGFYIIEVDNKKYEYVGSSNLAEETPIAEEPVDGLWMGDLVADSVLLNVDSAGVYHIVIDTDLEKLVVAEAKWGMIGAATPGGWGSNTPLAYKEADADKIVWETEGIELLGGAWKFRYSDGWKIFIDETVGSEVNVNTNLGGHVDTLSPGGSDMSLDEADAGVYTVTLHFNYGVGFTTVLEKTGDVVIPTYPDAMYLVGAGTAYGWDAPGTHPDAIMHKAAGGAPTEGIFWKIAHLEAGQGFKLSAADWTNPNLGFADVDEYNGVTVSENGGNMDIAESGMYMIVVNLRDEMTKVSIVEPMVYGIGDAWGGWDQDVAANLFTVDDVAKTITSPAIPADATSHRMYVDHEWIPDWWNSEFIVDGGAIVYRNDGGDPANVAVTAGQVITLSFDDNTGTIE